MTALSQKRLSVILPTMEQRDLAADKFCGLVPIVPPAQLKRLVDEGILECAIVQEEGIALYCFWYNLDSCGGFHINAAVRLAGNRFEQLVHGIEMTAQHLGARYIRFNTAQAGLIALGEKFGYKPSAVCLMKGI